jgi:hypothetical protein
MPQYDQNIPAQFGPEKLPTGWPLRLFAFSLLILTASLLIYVGLRFGYKPYLQNQIAEKEREIEQLAVSIPRENQEKLGAFYSQLLNLKNVLDNHVTASPIFSFLEKNTNKKVFYTRLDFDAKQNVFTLEGAAESYDILAEQLEAFNQAPDVKRFLINESQLSGGRIRFKISVFL